MVVVEGNEETKQIKGLFLYQFSPSNACQKVRACLEAKKLQWQGRLLSTSEQESDWYFTIHPQGLVPALVHDGVTHIESNDILLYLEEAFPEIPLMPPSEEGKQEVKSWIDLERTIQTSMKYLTFQFLFGFVGKLLETDERLAALKAKNPEGYAFHQQVKEGLKDEDLRYHIEKVHDVLQKLDSHLKDREWFVGDCISLADYCWIPNVFRYVKSYKFPVGRYPEVQRWFRRMAKNEAFQKGVVQYRGGPPLIVLNIKNSIQEFFGTSIRCFERGAEPNWTPALIATVMLPICFAFFPYASIASAINVSAGRSQTVINSCLAAVWARLMYSSYKKAHEAAKYIYLSRIHHMRALLSKSYEREAGMSCEDHSRPRVVLPDDVLIRVEAASINPIDLKVKEGYGKTIMNLLRRKVKIPAGDEKELPMILGHDCSGVVAAVGESVSKVKVGDQVWTALEGYQVPGTLAEYVLQKEKFVSHKPSTLTHIESASIPYTAVTVWSALVKSAGLGPKTTAGKRVLILGGTGGTGSFAIQLVKAWGGHVTTSCSTSGRDMVLELGADDVVDYTKTDLETALFDKLRFDVVLDTIGPTSYQACLNLCRRGGCVVSLVFPLLDTIEKHGLLLGIPKAVYDIMRIAIPQKIFCGRSFKYAFAAASGDVLDEVARLVDQNKIKAVVEKVYSLEDGNKAMEHLRQGHSRGKTVVVMTPNQ